MTLPLGPSMEWRLQPARVQISSVFARTLTPLNAGTVLDKVAQLGVYRSVESRREGRTALQDLIDLLGSLKTGPATVVRRRPHRRLTSKVIMHRRGNIRRMDCPVGVDDEAGVEMAWVPVNRLRT